MCTPPPSLLCIDISPGTPCHTYAQAAEAILRASSSTDYTWQTVYVSSDIMENPSRRDFAAIIDAVLACPGVEVFAIFCWTIPPLGCTDIKRLATAHPDIRRISLAHNLVLRRDLEDLERFAKESRTVLQLGYTL